MRISKRILSLLLALAVLCGMGGAALASEASGLDAALEESAEYIFKTVTSPTPGSIGGEWAVIGLVRSGYDVPKEYLDSYYASVEAYTKACGGVLHRLKYTEYSRVVLALTAIGRDPRNVAGYDLLQPLADYNAVLKQGINGPIWALIALDSGDYDIPLDNGVEKQATRELYIQKILSAQLSSGGWNLSCSEAKAADPDITGMALQALAKYRTDSEVGTAIERAIAWLSSAQDTNGGFSSYGEANPESSAQVIVALCSLGISLEDSRFVKNGCSLYDELMSYRCADGSFEHSKGGGSNLMASEQALCSMAAVYRAEKGQSSLYDMSADGSDDDFGLPGKHPDVKKTEAGEKLYFEDISGHKNSKAIEELASRGIINGLGKGLFAPDESMTRAQFAAITVRALGLEPKENGSFTDVAQGKWYSGFIGTANSYGIVNGRGEGIFDPGGTISRMEAAAMVARAAKLCGMDTEMADAEAEELLSCFTDAGDVPAWARKTMALCIKTGIMEAEGSLDAAAPILRCEIAQMLYVMLGLARLI